MAAINAHADATIAITTAFYSSIINALANAHYAVNATNAAVTAVADAINAATANDGSNVDGTIPSSTLVSDALHVRLNSSAVCANASIDGSSALSQGLLPSSRLDTSSAIPNGTSCWDVQLGVPWSSIPSWNNGIGPFAGAAAIPSASSSGLRRSSENEGLPVPDAPSITRPQ